MKRMMMYWFGLMAFVNATYANTETIGDFTWSYTGWYSTDNEWVAHISDVTPKKGEIVIPSQMAVSSSTPYIVESVTGAIFRDSEVNSLVISDGVRYIDGPVSCAAMERLVLPASIRLGVSAFDGCSNIKDITWPGDKRASFYLNNIYGITNIVVANGSTEIVDFCFQDCVNVQSVTMFNGITNIEANAFCQCYQLKQINLPNELASIGNSAFSGCVSMPNIIIPAGVCSIGSGAFSSCRQLREMILPASLYVIGEGAFRQCYNLTNVTFLGDAPSCDGALFENANRDLVIRVPVGSKGWDGNPESTALPKYWPFNTEGGRRIVHIGDPIDEAPPVITNFVYTTVTNCIFVTNVVHHYTTVTNVVHTYTTVTNVVKYVPEPGTSPDAGYAIGAGENRELAIAGAAGWDAFGVPDGMIWDKETGTLSGQAKLSGAYDVMLVSGSGADTQIMRTTLTVAPFDKIVGYVGVAFSQGGVPLNMLKSYKTLPAGLKWVSGGGHAGRVTLPGVLQGVPTKAQTLNLETVDGEPVTIEIKALPDAVVGTFDGCVYLPPSDPTNGVARPCDIIGTISLTATAAGKISASVKTAAKTYSFSSTSWTKFVEGEVFALEGSAALKTGESMQVNAYVGGDGESRVLVTLSGGEFGGGFIDDGHAGRVTLPGCVTEVVRDIYAKVGGRWQDEAAHALMAGCAGTYVFGFDRMKDDGGFIETVLPDGDDGHAGRVTLPAWTLRSVAKAEAAFLKVVVKDTGVATITGTLPDNTKVNCSTKATVAADGVDGVALRITTAAFSGKTVTLPLSIEMKSDGSPLEGAENCGSVYSVKR